MPEGIPVNNMPTGADASAISQPADLQPVDSLGGTPAKVVGPGSAAAISSPQSASAITTAAKNAPLRSTPELPSTASAPPPAPTDQYGPIPQLKTRTEPPVPAPDAMPQKHSNSVSWLKTAAQVMSGGPSYGLDANGNIVRQEPKISRTGALLAMVAMTLGAAGSGMSEHGPGSFGRSVQKGMEFQQGLQDQRQQQNEQTIKLADRHRQVVESTFKMHQMAVEMTMRSNEWNQSTAKAGMDTVDELRRDGYASAIKYPMVSEKELPQYMKEFGKLQPVMVRYIPHEPVQQPDGSWKEEHETFFASR